MKYRIVTGREDGPLPGKYHIQFKIGPFWFYHNAHVGGPAPYETVEEAENCIAGWRAWKSFRKEIVKEL